ncbi:MAG: hypothetical protein JWP40_1851 [Blastococcus sp.]|nr:hypothetical protein [Blastococcus sp.]
MAPLPDATDDLAYLSATELARRIAAKELSPVELLETRSPASSTAIPN